MGKVAVESIVCGTGNIIFTKADGTVWGCGYNGYGELGLGHGASSLVPTKLTIDNVKAVYCGNWYNIFQRTDRTVWGCGQNIYGQLGLGDTANRNVPTKLTIDNVAFIYCGGFSMIFLKTDGTIWGSGHNFYGQLGLGYRSAESVPKKISMDNVKNVYCGSGYTIFTKTDGTTWGCGYNGDGELGLGDTENRLVPTKISIENVKAAACGGGHTIFMKKDGTVWGCGLNSSGELGLGDTENRFVPTKISIENVKTAACGNNHTVFIKTDGTAWSCGLNSGGELGLGDTENRLVPTKISIEKVKNVYCGYGHTVFIKTDGTAWGCGYNGDGRLGLGNGVNRLVPTKLPWMTVLFHLLKIAEGYKTIKTNALTALPDTTLTEELLTTEGFANLNDIVNVQNELSQSFDLITYDEDAANTAIAISHLPPPQWIIPTEDIDVSQLQDITSIVLATTGTTGTVKVALSFDRGRIWKMYSNDTWSEITLTEAEVEAQGITPAALATIPAAKWAEVKTATLRVAYCLSKTATKDNLAVNTLTITGNVLGKWRKAKQLTDYRHSYPNSTTMVVKLLKDGGYKINYMDVENNNK